MKHFLYSILLIIIYSCSDRINIEKEVPAVLKEYLATESDSFNVRDLDREPSLQFDVALDTIYIPGNKRHTGATIFFPNLSETEYPYVHKQIKKIITDKKKEFLEDTKNEVVKYDSSWEMYIGRSMRIEPRSLYQNEKVISFSIECNRWFTGGTIGFDYSIINYDLEKKKQISLNDYFILNTAADTAYLDKIISGAVHDDFSLKRYADLEQQLKFSFDDLYVYFYFDRYDFFKWGASSVKKKYILEHINPVYR